MALNIKAQTEANPRKNSAQTSTTSLKVQTLSSMNWEFSSLFDILTNLVKFHQIRKRAPIKSKMTSKWKATEIRKIQMLKCIVPGLAKIYRTGVVNFSEIFSFCFCYLFKCSLHQKSHQVKSASVIFGEKKNHLSAKFDGLHCFCKEIN